MIYENFTPNYYSSLIKGQQSSILLDNLYWYVADGINKEAQANNNPKTIRDEQQILNQIIYGGKLNPNNTLAMIKRIDWVSGKVFGRYDSTDPDNSGKDFYCMNSLGSVYKCIDNNKNSPSTQEPQTTVPGTFQLSDGYIWHYMYKLTEAQINDYNIGGMIPLFIDPNVTAAVIRGTISTIDVKNPGQYTELASGSIQQLVSNNTVKIDDDSHNLSGTYNQMGFYITSGPGQGEYYQISGYTANGSGRYVTLNKPLVSAGLGSNYDIAPFVRIIGNGSGGSARAIMAGGQVSGIQILNRGAEYTLSQATLIANNTYVSNTGILDVNLSPSKGHGGDPYQELYVNHLLLNVDMDNYTIANDLPVDQISFCRVGTLRGLMDEQTLTLFSQPSFNNTFTAHIPPSFGNYVAGQTVLKYPTGAPQAKLVYANNTHIIGVYQTPFLRFQIGDTIVNSDNTASGSIIEIDQPQIKLIMTDVVSIANIETTTRGENSREIIQILVKIK